MSIGAPQHDSPAPAIGSTEEWERERKRRKLRRVWHSLLPVLTFTLLIFGWWAFVELAGVPEYILPAPLDVFPRLIEDFDRLVEESMTTMQEIFLGYVLAIVLAIPLGLLLAMNDTAKRALYPAVVFVQLIPKIAVAPLFLVWFGFGMQSKVLLVFLLTYFPLLLASMTGFSILDDRMLYLTRSMGASQWQTFRYLRLPSALPIIFSGLKTSATIAATAAIVAEFVGANKGLGYLLLEATSTLDTELIFAIILVLTLIGIGLNYLVEFVEYFTTPWTRKANEQ
jgi:NitT/TauT family transport system permease protein